LRASRKGAERRGGGVVRNQGGGAKTATGVRKDPKKLTPGKVVFRLETRVGGGLNAWVWGVYLERRSVMGSGLRTTEKGRGQFNWN